MLANRMPPKELGRVLHGGAVVQDDRSHLSASVSFFSSFGVEYSNGWRVLCMPGWLDGATRRVVLSRPRALYSRRTGATIPSGAWGRSLPVAGHTLPRGPYVQVHQEPNVGLRLDRRRIPVVRRSPSGRPCGPVAVGWNLGDGSGGAGRSSA